MSAIALSGADARMGFGKCPTPTLQANMNADSYAGKWYEIKRDSVFMWEMGQECVTEHFKPDGFGNHDLYFRGQFWQMLWTYMGVDGKLYCNNSNGLCETTMAGGDEKYPFQVLTTDYDNYAVNYFCTEMAGFVKMEWLNILSRSTTLDAGKLAEAENTIKAQLPEFDISDLSMRMTRQENCEFDWTK